MRVAAGVVGQAVELLIGDEAVSLGSDELDRLLEALAPLDLHEAASVAEDITALRLAGGAIRLLPTQAELEAVRLALVADEEREPLGPGLLRLAGLCDPARAAPPEPVYR
jgi:hypothetical protein